MLHRSFLKLVTVVPVVLVLMVAAACEDAGVLTGDSAPSSIDADLQAKNSAVARQGPGALTVMTRNVYIGAGVDNIIAEPDPNKVPFLVAEAFQTFIATNFDERAEAFALEIAAYKPHLVGLQEITRIRLQSPGDRVVGGTTPAEDVFLDHMDVLMSKLAAHGLDYVVAGIVQNLDVELPMIVSLDPLAFDDVRVTDFDVLLARGDVGLANVQEVNFAVGMPVPGLGTLGRGYVAADATVNGRTYRVATSHFESEVQEIRMAQAQELMSDLQSSPYPVVVMGDLNTEAPEGATYGMFMEDDFIDTWDRNQLSHAGPGFTCCHHGSLVGTSRIPDKRIDLVLFRSPNTKHGNGGLGSVFVEVVGESLADRTQSGLWASDHDGVVASLRVPN
jgi:hypothetical protein